MAVLSAGCSTPGAFGTSGASASASANAPTSGSTSSMTGRLAQIFPFKREAPPETDLPVYAAPGDTVCPSLDVRMGASTLTIPPDNADAFALRYQGTIGQMARECKVTNGVMRMKIGVQGRVLVGPAGGPARLDIPLRVAVVHEGPQPKTIATKLYKIPVTIPEGQTDVSFVQVDEDLTYPMPPVGDIHAYVVYVGFDPYTEAKKPAKKPAAKPRTSSRH